MQRIEDKPFLAAIFLHGGVLCQTWGLDLLHLDDRRSLLPRYVIPGDTLPKSIIDWMTFMLMRQQSRDKAARIKEVLCRNQSCAHLLQSLSKLSTMMKR